VGEIEGGGGIGLFSVANSIDHLEISTNNLYVVSPTRLKNLFSIQTISFLQQHQSKLYFNNKNP
jgi:hypothetical protein